jgi:uncharacterized protein (TIGR03066 family)
MRATLGAALAAVLCLGTGLLAEDKKADAIDAKKLIGKWQLKPAKGDKKDSAHLHMEFGKDGKVTESVSIGGNEDKDVMPYKVDGNTLTITDKVGGKELDRKLTITKLTDTELVLKSKSGEEDKYVRVKGK